VESGVSAAAEIQGSSQQRGGRAAEDAEAQKVGRASLVTVGGSQDQLSDAGAADEVRTFPAVPPRAGNSRRRKRNGAMRG